MPAYNAIALQEETGAKVRAIAQEDDVLRVVESQKEGHAEDGFDVVIVDQGEQGTQGSLSALLPVCRLGETAS